MKLPPYIYHAARTDRLDAIMQTGLCPRDMHGRDPVWPTSRNAVCGQCVYFHPLKKNAVRYSENTPHNVDDPTLDLTVLRVATETLDPDNFMLDHEELAWVLQLDLDLRAGIFVGENEFTDDEIKQLCDLARKWSDDSCCSYADTIKITATHWQEIDPALRRALFRYGLLYKKRIMYKGTITPQAIHIYQSSPAPISL